jgi:hypothetical protein
VRKSREEFRKTVGAIRKTRWHVAGLDGIDQIGKITCHYNNVRNNVPANPALIMSNRKKHITQRNQNEIMQDQTLNELRVSLRQRLFSGTLFDYLSSGPVFEGATDCWLRRRELGASPDLSSLQFPNLNMPSRMDFIDTGAIF